ncbi:hypothetical protein PMI09_00121 [Rhizobium sp. CF122]|uniref:hypothetical protein n=1 Tax=Rhizobium sp. CF122 TaxID=1144312 RepID=UPI000271B0F9|nr:hypothetical protein [Rhizobium sp. CF122]EJL58411.1 hypothetical protein PMI09_00121 [Rhizobium sp. CF122]
MPYDQKKSGQTNEEETLVQSVLEEAGYTGQVTPTDGDQLNPAAQLLVKLVRQGITDRGVLSGELRKHFGYVPVETVLYKPINKNRQAIQGIPMTRIPAANETYAGSALQAAAAQETVSSENDQLQADLALARKYLKHDDIEIAAQEARISGASLRGEPTSLALQELNGYFARQRYHRFELRLIEARIKAQ